MKFYPPIEPTYPRTNSFLDIALIDDRLQVTSACDNKIKTLDYDSDHKAILIEIDIRQSIDLAMPPQNPNNKFLFKKTNWNKFNTYLPKNNNQIIPTNKNLSIQETSNQINQFTDRLNDAINKIVPKYIPENSMSKYIDNVILNLKTQKKYLINLKRNNIKTEFNLTELINKLN